MTYNPKKDRPKNPGQWEILINDTLADEAAKAQADPFYKPMNREEVEAHFDFYYPREEQPLPDIPVPTQAELFAQLRSYRDARLQEYDGKTMQLNRLMRENPDYAEYRLKQAAWDAYATALCNLPEQAGAPWDGGGAATPWPQKPE